METVVKLLVMHFISKHSYSFKTSKSYTAKPEIAVDMTEDEWDYFLLRWEAYKQVTHMPEEDVVPQLIKCCSEKLHKDQHSADTYSSESSLLSVIKQMAVRKVNTTVRRVHSCTPKQVMPSQSSGKSHQKGRFSSLEKVSGAEATPSAADSEWDMNFLFDPDLYENKSDPSNFKYSNDNLKEFTINHEKEANTIKEKIGAARPGLIKRGKINKSKSKKVGSPTLATSDIKDNMTMLVMTLLTGSVILSTMSSDIGDASNAQVAAVSEGRLVIGHHVYHKDRGWLRQAARSKPLVSLH